jgi:hypothetical protein
MYSFYCPVKLRTMPTPKGLLGEGSRRKAAILLFATITAAPRNRQLRDSVVLDKT